MKTLYTFHTGNTEFLFLDKPEENSETVVKPEDKKSVNLENVAKAIDNSKIIEAGNKKKEQPEKEKWTDEKITKEVEMAGKGVESMPASELLKKTPKELQSLFLDEVNGEKKVNFHGNGAARRKIGAGDLFTEEFIKIDGVLGKRSLDPSFHGSKIGYVDRNGKYLPILGGEKISTEVSESQKEGFKPSLIDMAFSYKKEDGTTVTGEAAYKEQFLREALLMEEYEKLDWEEKVQKSDEDVLNTKVNLSHIPKGNEKMTQTIARIMANKDKYVSIQTATGVPWMLVAALHTRESGNDFSTYLHNGQPLGAPTTKVPKGVFFEKGQWEKAAVDALTNYTDISLKPDASLGEMALFAEKYNGMGYRSRGEASPYVYSGTDKYTRGKYVADGKYDASVVDQQLGVIPIILALRGQESVEHIS